MKKNITLIIMLIMVIILVALSLILGFKYVNNKKNLVFPLDFMMFLEFVIISKL